MSLKLHDLLDQYRLHSRNEFEKGKYFEKLIKVFLENDTLQGQAYDKVWLFKDWASEHDLPSNDTGIDLVARHADGSGFCAIQCKFYASDTSISKKHIDSFVSAASTKDFVSLVIVDTTLKDFSTNLKAMLDNLDKDWYRIALADLEKSRIDWSTYFRDSTVKLTEPIWRSISPHAFGNDGLRWHVRAFCHIDRKFKDFLLSRCLECRVGKVAEAEASEDTQWQETIQITLKSNPRLSKSQRRIIASDYDMDNNQPTLAFRKSLLYYFNRRLRLDVAEALDNPQEAMA